MVTQKGLRDLVSIESLPDRYRLHGVLYSEKVCIVDVSKALLDDGRYHEQKDWVTLTREDPWKVPSGPLYYAVCSALYANREHHDNSQRSLVDEIKNILATDFRETEMMTSTRIFYSPDGEDRIVHDFGYNTQRKIKRDIVGLGGEITKCSFDTIEALLGTRDCRNIQAIYSWFRGFENFEVHLDLLEKRPEHEVEERQCQLLLYDNLIWFQFDANGNVQLSKRARGIIVHRSEQSL